MEYPNPCARCGFCCLAEQCPISIARNGPQEVCQHLSFSEHGQATCGIAGIVPIGDGCCMSARAYSNGIQYDFASLTKNQKRRIVEKLRSLNLKSAI